MLRGDWEFADHTQWTIMCVIIVRFCQHDLFRVKSGSMRSVVWRAINKYLTFRGNPHWMCVKLYERWPCSIHEWFRLDFLSSRIPGMFAGDLRNPYRSLPLCVWSQPVIPPPLANQMHCISTKNMYISLNFRVMLHHSIMIRVGAKLVVPILT